MAFLDDFKIDHPSITDPYITVAEYGITFPRATINCLDKAAFIHVYFDDVKKRVAFQPCKDDEDAYSFYNPSIKNSFVRWSNKKIRDHIYRLSNIQLTKKGTRLDGKYLEDEKIVYFDLSNLSK